MKFFTNKKVFTQMISYALVGTVNFLVDFSIVNILMYLFKIYSGKFLALFNIISFFAYSTTGYFLNRAFTFKSHNSSYVKYVTVLGISMLADSLILSTLTLYNIFNINKILWANIVKLFSFMVTGTACFIINKFIIFKE